MAFRMFDIDKNNYIDKKEMEKLITIIYELTGETDRTGMNDPVIKVIQVMNKLGIV
jgi:Ca2+-binding EF-hand superfamily protein